MSDHSEICRKQHTHFSNVSESNKNLRSEGCHLFKPAEGKFTVRWGFSEACPVTPLCPASQDNLFQLLDPSHSEGFFPHTSVEVSHDAFCPFSLHPSEDFISIFSATSLFRVKRCN